MPTPIVDRRRTLVIWLLGILWIICTAVSLICEPVMAQAPKKAGKASAAGKDKGKDKARDKAAKSQRPPTPAPEPDEAAPRPEKREDPYIHVPPDSLSKQQVAKFRQDTIAALKAGRYEGNHEESLQTYYRKWVLPNWTQEENYYLLPKYRSDLRNNELRYGRNGPPHTDALTLLLGAMQRMSNENFHPAVRHNAMLMIGELNQVEPVGFNGVPTPLPDAVPVMITALTDEKQIDAVKVAALVGLVRHARLGIADQQLVAQRLIPALVKLASEKTPPGTRSRDGHDWLRSMAIDVLGLLRSVGNNNAVANALGAIVTDKKDVPEQSYREMIVRSAAARALGHLNYTNVSGLNPASLAEGLAGLAVEACGRQMARGSSEDEGEIPIVRRRLLAELNAVSIGFDGSDERHKGIRGLAQDSPNRDYVERLRQGVLDLMRAFDKKDRNDSKKEIDDAELGRELGGGATAITQMIAQKASGAAAPAEKDAKPPDDKSKAAPKEETPKPTPETPKKPEPKGF